MTDERLTPRPGALTGTAAPAEPPPRPGIAYLVGRYPGISHTFIHREVDFLSRDGWRIERFSIWRTPDQELLTPEDVEERDRTYSILRARPRQLIASLLAHMRALRHPRVYAGLLITALRLARPGARGWPMGLLWFLQAVIVWDRTRAMRLQHIHVHLRGTATFVALLASRLGKLTGTGAVSWSMTIHGPHEFYDVHREQLAVKAEDARFVICISDYARSQLMTMLPESSWQKLHVVHCGVDPTLFTPGRGEDQDSAEPGGAARVLVVGRLDPFKAHGILLQALHLLHQDGVPVELTVVGDGPRRASLEALAAELGIASSVEWTGPVGQDRIRDYFARADLFCLPSFAEGIPVVLMEAMAMAIPVISTHITGIPELIESGESGVLVRPGRPDELAGAISSLTADPELRDRLGNAGRQTVMREYDIRRSARLLGDVFSSEISGRNGAG